MIVMIRFPGALDDDDDLLAELVVEATTIELELELEAVTFTAAALVLIAVVLPAFVALVVVFENGATEEATSLTLEEVELATSLTLEVELAAPDALEDTTNPGPSETAKAAAA